MTFSTNVIVIFEEMLWFIEAEIKNNDCNDFLNDRDIIAFVNDDEFISVTHDRKKLIQQLFIASENRLRIVRNTVLFIDQINEYEDEFYDEFLMLRLKISEVIIVEVDRNNSCESIIAIITWRNSVVKSLIKY